MNKKVVVKTDALDRLVFEGIAEAESLRESIQADSDAVEDTFSAFYKSAPQVDQARDPHRAQLIEQMMQLPEYQALHQSTQLDDISAGLAAADFSRSLIEQIQKVEQKAEDLKDDGNPVPDDLGELMGEKGMGAMRAAMRRSLEKAEQTAEQWSEIKVGWGMTPGELKQLDPADRMVLAEKLLKDPKLKNISQLVGRFRNIVQGASTVVYSHGQDELYDIAQGRDLGQILPSEYLKLMRSPELFYADYLDGKLLQYNLKGTEPMGKGPIIAALDVSASMQGWREEYARALVMALITQAKTERRAFALIVFDSEVRSVQQWGKNSLVTLPERLAVANLSSQGGGTNFEEPLKAAMEARSSLNPELKPADLIFITDGECEIPAHFKAEFEASKKKTDLRVYGIAIGLMVESLADFCDDIYTITDQGQLDQVKDLVRKSSSR